MNKQQSKKQQKEEQVEFEKIMDIYEQYPIEELIIHPRVQKEFYKNKPDIRAVVHTHPVYSTIFAILNKPLKAVHYAIADAGVDEVPCAPYHLFGTVELAEEAIKACGNSKAVLLANHGLLTCGKDLESAYGLTCNMEFVAELQYRSMSIGTPVILNGQDMKQVLEKFMTYGQPGGKKGY